MSKIAYDPVKDRFASIVRRSSFLRTIFYRLLDLFFLRSWYIRSVVEEQGEPLDRQRDWTLLDAGCGFGQYDRFLLNRFSGVEIAAVDIKEDYLEDCRRFFRDEIEQGRISFANRDLLELEKENTYDFVICVDVLEHIEEDVEVISNLQRSLKSGGYFLMHSPSHYSESDAGGEDTFVDEHARAGYSKEEITRKVKKAGLEPLKVEYTYGRYGHTAWVMLIKYPMLLLNKVKLFALPLLALYYLFALPIGLILMKMDMAAENEWGTGIYALARKEF